MGKIIELDSITDKIGIGATASVHEFEGSKVIKLYYSRYSKNIIEYEYNIVKSIQGVVSVPQVYEMVKFKDRYGMIMDKISGKTIVGSLPGTIFQIKSLARNFATLQHTLHSIETTELPDYTEEISNSIHRATLLNKSEKDEIIQILEELPRDNNICHGDYHPDNVMLNHQRELIVIDWVNARKGHPLLDYARTIILLKYGTPPSNSVVRFGINIIRSSFFNNYSNQYTKLSSHDFDDLDQFLIPIMAARLIEKQGDEKILVKEIRKRLKA